MGQLMMSIFGGPKVSAPSQSGDKLTDLTVQTSTQGEMICKVYGTVRVAGNIIWARDITEVQTTTTQGGGGKGGGGSSAQTTNTTYTYFVTMAIAICEGPINSVLRIWADSEVLTDDFLQKNSNNFYIYTGTETQNPDPIMESFDGVGNVPAYRGVAYIVMKDFPLQNFGNRIPNFTFEVLRSVQTHPNLQDKVKQINLIPGAGENVYDPIAQKKVTYTAGGVALASTGYTNVQTPSGVGNVLMSLDQLQATFPNLEYISLVVCWFASDLDAGTCLVQPRVEYGPGAETVPDAWSVGAYNRSNTPVVLHFPDGSPTYGGTPSDISIIRLVQEIKSRGLKVNFYPLIFVDTLTKPWRGRIIPANATDAANWFTKTNGYNDFITHYANLSVGGYALKDHIDSFVIGSEYIGMTSATFSSGVYPAVTGFVNLAATVKGIVGSGVKTVYAADWSEYHHAAGGWFNMDPLWSSANLDILGIDNYMPLTPDLPQSQIDYNKIYSGWTQDEGWDYYFDNRPNSGPGTSNLVAGPITTTNLSTHVTLDLTGFFNAHLEVGESFVLAGLTSVGGISAGNLNGTRTVLSVTDTTHIVFVAGAAASSSTSGGGSVGTINKPKYFDGFKFAWKNIQYFWENTHVNPDLSTTAWTSKMKPIWFTEFGFPSVDACANEPNVFVDPSSSESFYPRESLHRIDFAAQRQALNATCDYWDITNAVSGNTNLVPKKFVWTWDARPYPYWPNLLTVWADGRLWPTGHWLNGKLGGADLGAIVADILEEVGITSSTLLLEDDVTVMSLEGGGQMIPEGLSDAYDVSELTGEIDGFIIKSIMSARDAIQILTVPYLFDMVESDGILKFIPRGNNSIVTIDQNDLLPQQSSGNSSGNGSPSSLRVGASISRKQETDLPQSVTVSYINAANQYEQNTQIAQRQTTDSLNQTNYDWPISMPDQIASNIANKLLYQTWIERIQYKFSLPPKYAYLEPTDVLTITLNNVDYNIRIVDSTMQKNGSQDMTGVANDVSVYDMYIAPGNGVTNQQVPLVIPAIQLTLLDLPAFPGDGITDAELGTAAVALAPNWRGTNIYRSDDGGEAGGNTFNTIEAIGTQSTEGVALSVLASGTVFSWDYANTLQIQMYNGTLSSVTELAVLNGSNTAYLGGELIQFQNATLISEGIYEISKLLRGRLGTEDKVGTHVANEVFTMLDSTMIRLPMAYNFIGLLKYYKAVALNDTLSNTTEQSFIYTARCLMPYSVVQIAATRNMSLDIDITWVRRTRIGGELRDGVNVPLSEASEAYEVDIYNGPNVVRTLSSIIQEAIYTAADQITDFGSTQSSVSIIVYQMSQLVGRGIPSAAIV